MSNCPDLRFLPWMVAGILITTIGCHEPPDPIIHDDEPVLLVVDGSRLLLDPDGWVDIYDEAGRMVVQHGVGMVMLDDTGDGGTALATDDDGERSIVTGDVRDGLGDGRRTTVTKRGTDGSPDLMWAVTAYPSRGCFTFQVNVHNSTDETIHVAKASALLMDALDGGALFMGEDPSTHRILENGSHAALDFTVEILPGDAPYNDAYATVAPGDYQGHSVASWNHGVTDLAGEDHWVAGALSFESTTPVINLSYNSLLSLESDDGRAGFSFFSAEGAYLPEPRLVEPGWTQSSELFYVRPAAPDAIAGMEQYAHAVADHLDLTPFNRRGDERVPNGWNSWAGSGSTGGYGTDINEEVILANLDVMATELRDWGIDWFQIDDGYEPYYGDWWWVEDRFPHGAAWMSQQIRDAGLRPGLWMAPFSAHADSQIVADHPDWFADKVPLGQAVVEDEILDLSNPEVQAYLHDLFTTFRYEWGFEWLKLDFGYQALFGTNLHDPYATREEAWRQSMKEIRYALGDDAFFILVGTLGTNYGIVDSGRLSLDTMPIWDWEITVDDDFTLDQQGLKPGVRAAGRRWYLQDRVWVNHPDLIFFRSNPYDETWPPLTFEESRAFCTFVALSGGIVKLGDRLVDLDGDAIKTIRTLLPIYGHPGTPLDLFEREFPEVWHQSVIEPLDGYDENYELIALFDWGKNRDLTVNPYEWIEDDGQPTTHTVDLDALGLDGNWLAYEFWTGEFLGTVSGQLTHEVPSHDSRMIALRRPLEHPRFLGWNRQITMGGTVLEQASWSGASGEFHLAFEAAAATEKAPFTYEIAIHVPAGHTFVSATSGQLPDLAAQQFGDVLQLTFVPAETMDVEIILEFD